MLACLRGRKHGARRPPAIARGLNGGMRYTGRMVEVANELADPPPDIDAGTLGLWDAVSLVVGIVVGTAIFRSSPMVFANTSSPLAALGAWTLGGVLSLVGALCYAELATTYPRSGGDYEYLTRAFGRWAGFLFGWAQLTAVFAANLGAMAFAFGDYGTQLLGLGSGAVVWLAVTAILAMTTLNAVAVNAGARTQVMLSGAKILGLAAVVVAGVLVRAESPIESAAPVPPSSQSFAPSFGLAMVFVLYAFGGWSDAAFVAAEVRNRSRNLPLAIVGGVAAITLVYLAVNWAYLRGLGFAGAQGEATPAAAVVEHAVGPVGGKLVSCLVMISALGAINGMILSRARVFAMLGDDHRVLSWLGGWRPGQGAPRASLIGQAAVTLALVLVVGTMAGKTLINRGLTGLHLPTLDWDRYGGGFETLVTATAPVFWSLFLATGIAMMVLRQRDSERERPFTAPLYPLTPLVFCATCVYMLYSSIDYARWLAAAGAAPVALGLVLYAVTRKR
jgi:APA family basic amino acid/polyamine antiporter